MHNTIPYLVSGLVSASSYISQTTTTTTTLNPSLWIQAGMAGIVVLLLLKFFPMVLTSMKEEAAANRQIIREIVSEGHKKDAAWQEIVADRHLCPKDKQGN